MQKIYRTHWFIFNEIKSVQFLALLVFIMCAGYLQSFSKSSFYLEMVLLILLPVIQYSVGPFRGQAHVNPHLIKSMDTFFSYLPFSEKEKLIFIISDKFYIFLPISFTAAYLSTLKNFNVLDFFFISLGLIFLSVAQNVYMYSISKYNEVDRQLSHHLYFRYLLALGRNMLVICVPLAIMQLRFVSTSIFFLVSASFLTFLISMYFWKVKGYEQNVHETSTKIITHSVPVTFIVGFLALFILYYFGFQF